MANNLSTPAYNTAQLRTIRRTVASDTNDQEFNLFMEACKAFGLCPFRKQIFAVVYSKSDETKRKMSIIVSRDGQRVIAHRCKDYRPAEEPAAISYQEDLISETNPLGIVSVTIRLFKQDNKGDWHPVVGEAYWDEFAPITYDQNSFDWVETGEFWPDTGKPKKRKIKKEGAAKTLDKSGQWAKMPRIMITKCAEMQALRAGWPDQFGGIYSEEEMGRLEAEATATEEIEQLEEQERLARIGGPGILFAFDETMKLEKVALGSVMDRCLEFIETYTPEEVHVFRIRNEIALREFWAHNASDALELKKAIEAKEALFDPSSDMAAE